MARPLAPTTVDPSRELLERGDELEKLGECMDTVQRRSHGCVVLIGGEAGVGKTALLRRFCDDRPAGARPLGRLRSIVHAPSARALRRHSR